MKLVRAGIAAMVAPLLLLQGIAGMTPACPSKCCACAHHGGACCASHAPHGQSDPQRHPVPLFVCCAPVAMTVAPAFRLTAPASMRPPVAVAALPTTVQFARIPFKVPIA